MISKPARNWVTAEWLSRLPRAQAFVRPGIIVLSLEEIPPATRLEPLSYLGSCNGVDGILYEKLRGLIAQ